MKNAKSLILIFGILLSSYSFAAEEKKQGVADHLQNISVTIRAESDGGASEGSGVVFTRKDSKGNSINLVWTAAHVIRPLRSERKTLVNGVEKTLVEFKDSMVVKEIRQDGRIVGRLQMDAEVLKYSDAINGHDLALLRVRKYDLVSDSVTFYLDEQILPLGTELLHVGSLLGQTGANSMTAGIYSQHGRILKEINKFVYDQTTVTAFPGSSGGGVYLKGDARYVGMLVRGAGEGFNLIVPVRRMVTFSQKHEIMWALDPSVKMPETDKLNEIPIEHGPEKGLPKKEPSAAEKAFPFLIQITSGGEPKVKIENK